MPSKLVTELDQDEKKASSLVYKYLMHAIKIGEWLEANSEVHTEGELGQDTARVSELPVSQYAPYQIRTAVSCFETVKRIIVQEQAKTYTLALPLNGDYALVRNAIDCLAIALWLLEPPRSILRVKRRLLVQKDENLKHYSWLLAMNEPDPFWRKEQNDRLVKFARVAGLTEWDPLSKSEMLSSTTKILKQIERWHTDPIISWLATWQLASGHAHGKLWAVSVSHDFKVVEGTETAYGAEFFITGKYSSLALILKESIDLLDVCAKKYYVLSRAPKQSLANDSVGLPLD